MAKMIQIRHVPDDLHRALKAKAARLGMSLSDYLLSEIAAVAERPTLGEWVDRVRSRKPAVVDETPAEIIRRHRDA